MTRYRAHGAARTAAGLGSDGALPPELPETVREALARADVAAHEAHLAWELARLAPGLAPHEQLALTAIALLTQEGLARGSTRIPIDPEWLARQARMLSFEAPVIETIPSLLARLDADPLCALFGRDRPLAVDGAHLYQGRLLALEERLAALVTARLRSTLEPEPELDAALETVSTREQQLTDEQRSAVRAALASPLCVVSGGPGTGKTSIVVAIVRAALACGRLSPESIALAAPTGKAKERMRRAVEGALGATLPPPVTLHRLLGYSPSRRAFTHDREHPLANRLVIVDESSMIDVFLMEQLLASLRRDARLVLLGDAEQLPSVAAGAVFRDLGPSTSLRTGPTRVPAVRLTKSHRMNPELPTGFNILKVAERINAGELAPLVSPREQDGIVLPSDLEAIGRLETLPTDPERLGGVFLYEPAGPLEREAFADFWLEHFVRGRDELARRTWPRIEGRIASEAARELALLFEHTERARLLCVTRSAFRPTGVDAINAALHRRFAERSWLSPGEPILVMRNDYERNLWNGDQGLVLFTAADGERPRPSAVFRQEDGFVAHPLESVRASIELGFATTVHKAQGSEHGVVALLVPETDTRLLTREIVYTAITRARRTVLLIGSPELLARATGRRIERETGVGERIARD